MKKLFFFTVLNSNFSNYEIEDSKFVNSVHGVEYEIIGEIPDAKIAKKGTGISTTATFVNKYSFAPSMISMEKKLRLRKPECRIGSNC